MKSRLHIILFLGFIAISNITFSQQKHIEIKEVNEITQILNDITNGKLILPIYLEMKDTLILPSYFSSYNEFLQLVKRRNLDAVFFEFKSLKNKYRIQITNQLKTDTNKLYINPNWFVNNRIKILSDSITENNKSIYFKFIKPVFFNNYTRCYFASFYGGRFHSFFLKKKNEHWIFDDYYISIDD